MTIEVFYYIIFMKMDKRNEIMVSVVLPVYNGEKDLEAAIDSVLQQSYSDLELILVNDCSTDGTADIIKKAVEKDSRVCSITNQTNQKLPESLNIGFRQARGDFFTWTSDDNRYDRDAIRVMVEALEQDKDAVLVYCDYTPVDAEGKVLEECTQQKEKGNSEDMIRGNQVGACFLYRREVAEKVGEYDKNLFLVEDYDYWLRIFEAGKMIHVNQKLYFYQVHAGSLTATRAEEIRHKTVECWKKHWKFIFSRLHGLREKCLFCHKVYYMENVPYRRQIFRHIVRHYPPYLFYRIVKPFRDCIRRTAREDEL